ncbi:MAG: serine/threonine-protein kinase [Planctomycetota bacterium]
MQSIGSYELLAELGRGGMGVVYRARDRRTGREVALKLLLGQRGASEPARRRTAIEVAALTRLHHPHLVAALDAGEEHGAPWLALELIEGASLEERLRRQGPLPLDAALRLGRELAEALASVHAEGLLHRDLKPENVLLRERDGAALLTDFGLALDLEASYTRLTQTGRFLGTPGYWSPEQARGDVHSFSPATDIYGLGAVLYAALTGGPPVQGESLAQFLEPASFQRVAPPRQARPEVPVWLSALCMRCLSPAPEARPASAAEVARALAAGGAPRGRRLGAVGLLAAGVLLALAGWGARARSAPVAASAAPSAPSAAQPSPPREAPPTARDRRAEELFQQALAAGQAKRGPDALRLLREAAELGHVEAMKDYGFALANGQGGGARDPAEGARWTRRAAEGGSAQAMTYLGYMLGQGLGVDRDEEEAARWYRRAIDLRHAPAAFNLALLFDAGRTTPRDPAAAARYYRVAAEGGVARAMNNLGVLLKEGRGVPQDLAQAAEWFRRGAEAGHAEAMQNLALSLVGGRGVPRDEAEAMRWLRRAAQAGSASAMTTLAATLAEGSPAEQAESVGWARRAAATGDPGGLCALAGALQQGRGVARDPAAALELYRRAAALNYPSGMFNLGGMLFAGDGVPQDQAQAVQLYRRAADLGFVPAMFNLAVALSSGQGVPRDDAEAVRWYRRAAEGEDSDAMYNLAVMLEGGRGLPSDPDQAASWYRRALTAGSPQVRRAARDALTRMGR